MNYITQAGNGLMLGARWLVWFLDLDDGSGTKDWRKATPSAVKMCGLASVIVALYAVVKALEVTVAQIGLATMGISALFGRSMWRSYLHRPTRDERDEDTAQIPPSGAE